MSGTRAEKMHVGICTSSGYLSSVTLPKAFKTVKIPLWKGVVCGWQCIVGQFVTREMCDCSLMGDNLFAFCRPTMIKYGIRNIRDLVGHKVDLEMVYNNPICRLDS